VLEERRNSMMPDLDVLGLMAMPPEEAQEQELKVAMVRGQIGMKKEPKGLRKTLGERNGRLLDVLLPELRLLLPRGRRLGL